MALNISNELEILINKGICRTFGSLSDTKTNNTISVLIRTKLLPVRNQQIFMNDKTPIHFFMLTSFAVTRYRNVLIHI
jgi:hypothetical protein